MNFEFAKFHFIINLYLHTAIHAHCATLSLCMSDCKTFGEVFSLCFLRLCYACRIRLMFSTYHRWQLITMNLNLQTCISYNFCCALLITPTLAPHCLCLRTHTEKLLDFFSSFAANDSSIELEQGVGTSVTLHTRIGACCMFQ